MSVQDIVKNKPYLAWYTKNQNNLSDGSVLEHVLNYGNWEDVGTYIKIKGIKKTAEIFKQGAFKNRTNYFPEIKHYFARYFQKYAS